MRRRQVLQLSAATFASGVMGCTGASDGWNTDTDKRLYQDSTFAVELESGDQLRVTVVNDQGYMAFAYVTDTDGDTIAELEVETEDTIELFVDRDGVYRVYVVPGEIAEVTIEIKSGD